MPVGMFGRPQTDCGVPFLLPIMMLGSRQAGVQMVACIA